MGGGGRKRTVGARGRVGMRVWGGGGPRPLLGPFCVNTATQSHRWPSACAFETLLRGVGWIPPVQKAGLNDIRRGPDP